MKRLHSAQPWYFGYALQGAAILGCVPILIPLIVARSGGAAHAGLVVAAFYLGEFAAPLWGVLADKTKRYGLLYLGGFVLIACGMSLFAMADTLWAWLFLALCQGAGAGATNTVAGIYIVEFQPKAEWDSRIGWLQTFYGTGQALGLILAAWVQADPGRGMLLAGLLMVPALFIGRIGLPRTTRPGKKHPLHSPTHGGRLPFLHHYHRPDLASLKAMFRAWKSPFFLFMASWFLVTFGSWMLYNLYPLVMNHVYAIHAGASSAYFAVGAGIGVFAYAPSGVWGKKWGEGPVLLVGYAMSLLGLLGMSVLVHAAHGLSVWLAPLFYVLLPIAWSPLIVAGTGLTARFATMSEGRAMGLFNANTAIASVISAVAAGQIAERLSYAGILYLGVGITAAGIALFLPLLPRSRADKGPGGSGKN